MGLTSSYEVIERHANPTPNEPDAGEAEPSYVGKTLGQYFHNTATQPPPVNTKRSLADYELPRNKKKKREPQQGVKRPGGKSSGKSLGKASGKAPAAGRRQNVHKGSSKSVKPRATTPSIVEEVSAAPENRCGSDDIEQEEASALPPPRPPPVNAHRAKIAVGKQALAAIKEGTRIYIKSGEGNGGDTWWDSGVIQKIHERGKRFEVAWQGINNRGEEVDTNVEKRIDLPVTYSLAGAAADAIARASPGTHGASLARKSVLAAARIGSWCIQYPEEPWGMLDPFGEDSSIST